MEDRRRYWKIEDNAEASLLSFISRYLHLSSNNSHKTSASRRYLRLSPLVFPVVLLLFFGSGGLGLMRCACTGNMQLLLPTDDCCQGEDGCMTVTIAQVSDADLSDGPSHTLFHFPPLAVHYPLCASQPQAHPAPAHAMAVAQASPPGVARLSMVMRV